MTAPPANLLDPLRRLHAGAVYRWLAHAASRPLHPGAAPAVVIAPHQDDEALGCGGMIALKRRQGAAVKVVFLTDGRSSHAFDPSTDRDALARARHAETLAAGRALGLAGDDLDFLDYPDGRLNALPPERREQLIDDLAERFRSYPPGEIYVPHRRDRHPDHEAAFEYTLWAVRRSGVAARVLQYSIWSHWLAPILVEAGAAELAGARRLSVAAVLGEKKKAVAAYATQLAVLPRGFVDRFLWPHEIYFEHPGGT